jgi:hypothetical protein
MWRSREWILCCVVDDNDGGNAVCVGFVDEISKPLLLFHCLGVVQISKAKGQSGVSAESQRGEGYEESSLRKCLHRKGLGVFVGLVKRKSWLCKRSSPGIDGKIWGKN